MTTYERLSLFWGGLKLDPEPKFCLLDSNLKRVTKYVSFYGTSNSYVRMSSTVLFNRCKRYFSLKLV